MRKNRVKELAIMVALSMLVVACSNQVSDGGNAAAVSAETTAAAESSADDETAAESEVQREEVSAGAALEAVADGTYEGSAQGFGGEVTVQVTVANHAITDIQVDTPNETAEIGGAAAPRLAERIVEGQSLMVDAVSGATVTSSGVLAAVETALAGAGADVEALKAVVVAKNGEDEEMTTQIVVVGGGASGTAAALQAAEAGSDVVVVEMTSTPAGQGTMAGGLFAVDSTQQKESGETVDPKWIYDEFVQTGNYQVNGGLLANIISMSGETVDWLEEHGCRLTLAHPGTGGYYEHRETHPAATLHGYTDGGTAGITALQQELTEMGGQILFETQATELIMENGKAAGIRAQKADGGILTIHADAVILASGGFGGNEELVRDQFGEGYGVSRVGTNIGTGIDMAMSAGADAGYDKAITMHYGVSRGGTGWGTELNSALLNPYLHVDVDGNRFMNEENFIFEPIKSSNVIKSLPRRTAYEIFDATMIETVKEGGVAALTDVFGGELATNPTKFIEVGHEIDTAASYEKSIVPVDLTEEIEALVAEGKIISAESPEELAEKLNMAHLTDTIARYNELCDNGADTDQFKNAKYLDKLEGTLYAVPITPSVFLGTLGGVEINQYCEVIDEQGKAIEGLYAAGSDTSGVYGNSYVYFEGGTLGYAYNSGRLAGQSAAGYVTK